jgi:hypothetical protein
VRYQYCGSFKWFKWFNRYARSNRQEGGAVKDQGSKVQKFKERSRDGGLARFENSQKVKMSGR